MTNTQCPSNYCTTDCGQAARDSDPIAYYHRDGQPMTLTCTHYGVTR